MGFVRGLLSGALILGLPIVGCQKEDTSTSPDPDTGRRIATFDLGPPIIQEPDAAVEPGATDAFADILSADAGVIPPPSDAGLSACADGLDNDEDGLIDLDDRGCDGPDDDDELDPVGACADGMDNDGDGRVDLADSDCINQIDPLEDGLDPIVACNNRLDDDGDGLTDFPADPGCGAAGDGDETTPPVARACGNGRDDDEDGAIDYPNDPGCSGSGDPDETDPPVQPECADGEDNDGNGTIDYPADPGCTSAGDFRELNVCGTRQAPVVDLRAAMDADGGFNGTTAEQEALFLGSCGGGAGGEAVFSYRVERPLRAIRFSTNHPETTQPTVLYARRNCGGAADLACNRGAGDRPGTQIELLDPTPGLYYIVVDTGSRNAGPGAFRLTVETVAAALCRDELDNDEDGLIDLADPGCAAPMGLSEADPEVVPQCFDGEDNDLDGLIDFPEDPECAAAGGRSEGARCVTPFPNVAVLGQAGGLLPVEVSGRGEGLTDGSCRVRTGPEFVVALTLDEFSLVTVIPRALGEFMPLYMLHMRTDCDDVESELACQDRFDEPAIFELPAGTYYFFVDHSVFNSPPDPVEVEFIVESRVTECNDEADNDGDGAVDLADPGCESFEDRSEDDPREVPACGDGIDNDEDGQIDWPADDGCTGSGDTDENFACLNAEIAGVVPPGGGRVRLTTRAGENRFEGNCGGGRGADGVIMLRLDRAATVTAEIVDTDFDTVLHVRSLCDEQGSELACDDDDGVGLLSRISQRFEAGTYFFIADAFGGGVGEMTVEFTIR